MSQESVGRDVLIYAEGRGIVSVTDIPFSILLAIKSRAVADGGFKHGGWGGCFLVRTNPFVLILLLYSFIHYIVRDARTALRLALRSGKGAASSLTALGCTSDLSKTQDCLCFFCVLVFFKEYKLSLCGHAKNTELGKGCHCLETERGWVTCVFAAGAGSCQREKQSDAPRFLFSFLSTVFPTIGSLYCDVHDCDKGKANPSKTRQTVQTLKEKNTVAS